MKKLVSAILAAVLLLSLAGSALADWTDTPWVGGKDLRQHTDAHPSLGNPAKDHPAPRLIQKEPVKLPTVYLKRLEDVLLLYGNPVVHDINGWFDKNGNPTVETAVLGSLGGPWLFFTLRGIYFYSSTGFLQYDSSWWPTLTDYLAQIYVESAFVQIYP